MGEKLDSCARSEGGGRVQKARGHLAQAGYRGRALLQDAFLLPQPVGVREPGLGFAHHPTSCFFQPTPPHPRVPLGGLQTQLPYLGAFSPARSQHAPSGSQAPSLPPRGLCGPHVSPSTSALSLVLSHGDWRKVSQGAPFWASPNVPQDPVGEGRGTATALGPLHLQR